MRTVENKYGRTVQVTHPAGREYVAILRISGAQCLDLTYQQARQIILFLESFAPERRGPNRDRRRS